MSDRIVIDVSRDGWTGRLQLGISQLSSQRGETDRGSGLRLSGPKFNGSSERLLRFEVGQQDADDIRKFLNVVDPQPKQPSRAEVLREAADVFEAGGNSHAASRLREMADDAEQVEKDLRLRCARKGCGKPVTPPAVWCSTGCAA
jgi:hypothetical protein